jgi:hypothetical protein
MQTVSEDELLIIAEKGVEAMARQKYDSVPSVQQPRRRSRRRISTGGTFVSSLDFERIVNQYSIQAVRDQWLLPPLPADGSASASGSSDRNNNPPNSSKRQRRSSIQGYRPRPKNEGKHLLGYTGRTATRWLLSALAGLLTGLISNVIVSFSIFFERCFLIVLFESHPFFFL